MTLDAVETEFLAALVAHEVRFVVIGDTSKLESSPPYKAYGYIILGVLVVAAASFEFFKKR